MTGVCSCPTVAFHVLCLSTYMVADQRSVIFGTERMNLAQPYSDAKMIIDPRKSTVYWTAI